MQDQHLSVPDRTDILPAGAPLNRFADRLRSGRVIHEGAHFLYAILMGVYKELRFMGLGIQIDIYRELLTDTQLGIFCLVGILATQIAAYGMVAWKERICHSPSKLIRACCYYITIALLLLDPVYLSLLCGFFGGGDMNGIALLIPELAARFIYSALLVINACLFWKRVLPAYKAAFAQAE